MQDQQRISETLFSKWLDEAPPAVQAHVKALQEDSKQLQHLLIVDPGDELTLCTQLGSALMEYITLPQITEKVEFEGIKDNLLFFYDRFGHSVKYASGRFGTCAQGQTPVPLQP